jgi:hypothetical protein
MYGSSKTSSERNDAPKQKTNIDPSTPFSMLRAKGLSARGCFFKTRRARAKRGYFDVALECIGCGRTLILRGGSM